MTEIWSGIAGRFLGKPVGVAAGIDALLEPGTSGVLDLILTATPMRLLGSGAERAWWNNLTIEFPTPDTVPCTPPPGIKGREAAGVPRRDAAVTSDRADGVPLFSILTPVHNPPADILEKTLASVSRQTFDDWELCLVDDGSSDPEIVQILQRAVTEDGRVRLLRHEQAGGIANATNSALELASGEFVALLDHDDLLADDALERFAAAIAGAPTADMLYSDEDVIEDDRRIGVFLKPEWSPDLLRSQMYTSHLGVYRRLIAVELGGFRAAFDGSQDYDFALRFSERARGIVHVPGVLYHWRSHEKSVAANVDAKPHAYPAAQRALSEHLQRLGVDAEVHFGPVRGVYRVIHPPALAVTMILPITGSSEKDLHALRCASRSWVAEERASWELVLVGAEADVARSASSLPPDLRKGRLRTLAADPECGRAGLFNRAAKDATGDCLALLEGPWEALTRDWLSRLAGFGSQPDIGAVGAKTVSGDGRVEHAGIVLSDGLPVPVCHGAAQSDFGPLGILHVIGNLGAVNGTIVTRREVFERLAGFDERFDRLAPADFCLRALGQGMRIVSAPDVVLRRTDGEEPVNDLEELRTFRTRWGGCRGGGDPYFSASASAGLTGIRSG